MGEPLSPLHQFQMYLSVCGGTCLIVCVCNGPAKWASAMLALRNKDISLSYVPFQMTEALRDPLITVVIGAKLVVEIINQTAVSLSHVFT